jgi:hypothetical protein
MPRWFAFAVIFALRLASTVAVGAEVRVEGVVKAVDAKERTLTVEKKSAKGTKVLSLEVANEVGDLASLKVGSEVSLSYDSTLEVVTAIEGPRFDRKPRVSDVPVVSGLSHGRSKTVKWDARTLVLIEQGGNYGRIIRLKDGSLLCCYDLGGRIHVKHSKDDGKTWGQRVFVADYEYGNATNAELLELSDGRILCLFNERPSHHQDRFAIAIAESLDKGMEWSKKRRIYEAGRESRDGCWEPAGIQLPDGEVQIYFANEAPYRETDEQEITMMRSRDRGKTWGSPKAICFRQGHRDGMPVPLVLKGKRGIAVAIEDNGLAGPAFKPTIVHTSLHANWADGPVGPSSPNRWPALADPLPPRVNAAAPYLCQYGTGETLLSFQMTDDSRSQPHMVVAVGDDQAKHFNHLSVPFTVGPETACLWNSLFIKSGDVVTAISHTSIDGTAGLWAVDGVLITKDDGGRATGPSIVATWQHRVGDGPPVEHRFFANGRINNANGTATWTINGSILVMRWPNPDAPGGAWVDTCTVSGDGLTYTGRNQNDLVITGNKILNKEMKP